MNENTKYLSPWIWSLLLVVSISLNIYLISNEKPTFDESKYTKKVDSLNVIILKNDSLNWDIEKKNLKQEDEINKLQVKLTNLNKRYKYYEDLYNKSLDSLSRMSDNDVTNLFTNTFK
jgi:hypothetical protein